MTDDQINPKEYLTMQPGLTLPADTLAAERTRLMAVYGFEAVADAEFDAIAQRIVDQFGVAVAGVNRLDADRNQFFVGMAWAAHGREALGVPDDVVVPTDDHRRMAPTAGFCSTLITRPGVKQRTALALENVMEFPLFSTNFVVDAVGVQSYLGAQIVAPEGTPIGSVWGIDTKPRKWVGADLDFMKGRALDAMDLLRSRAQR